MGPNIVLGQHASTGQLRLFLLHGSCESLSDCELVSISAWSSYTLTLLRPIEYTVYSLHIYKTQQLLALEDRALIKLYPLRWQRYLCYTTLKWSRSAIIRSHCLNQKTKSTWVHSVQCGAVQGWATAFKKLLGYWGHFGLASYYSDIVSQGNIDLHDKGFMPVRRPPSWSRCICHVRLCARFFVWKKERQPKVKRQL